MKSLAKHQPIKPQQGNVRTHAKTIFPATFHLTFFMFFAEPTPIIEEVLQCEVETGIPVKVAIKSIKVVLKLEARP